MVHTFLIPSTQEAEADGTELEVSKVQDSRGYTKKLCPRKKKRSPGKNLSRPRKGIVLWAKGETDCQQRRCLSNVIFAYSMEMALISRGPNTIPSPTF